MGNPSQYRPQDAVDDFLKIHRGEVELIHKGWAVVVKKL